MVTCFELDKEWVLHPRVATAQHPQDARGVGPAQVSVLRPTEPALGSQWLRGDVDRKEAPRGRGWQKLC